jgi:hypothetical protein
VRNLRTIKSDGAKIARAEQQAAKERLDAKIRGLASLSDEELMAKAPARAPFAFPWHEMEMQRRLKDSIEGLTKETAKARWWALWGSAAIAALTVVLVVLTIVLAMKA